MACSPAKRQAVEICPNLHPRKIWVNLRTQRPSTLIFVRTLSQFTTNDRILRSRFDQGRTAVVRTAPGGEYPSQQMEICTAFFTLKMACCHEMSQRVEVLSNLQVSFFDLKVRHRGSQSSIFVRTFRSFTRSVNLLQGAVLPVIHL